MLPSAKKPALRKNSSNTPPKDDLHPQVAAVMKISETRPKQRTQKWKNDRHQMITASELASTIKLTEYEIGLRDAGIISLRAEAKPGHVVPAYKSYGELMRSKCLPEPEQWNPGPGALTAMNHGTAYEPVATALHEMFTNQTIHEFNLIPHPTIKFLGASPDGISTEGVMLEVKCPHRRQPQGGVPQLQYWIQMQLQMECCNLDSCDFLEVVVREYKTKEDYLADRWGNPSDPDFPYSRTAAGRAKGLIIVRSITDPGEDTKEDLHYYYPPVLTFQSEEEENEWINNWAETVAGKELHEDKPKGHGLADALLGNHIKYFIKYWYIEEYHCVNVKRDKVWFQQRLPEFEEFWNLVVRYRKEGVPPHLLKRERSSEPSLTRSNTSKLELELNECLFTAHDDEDE